MTNFSILRPGDVIVTYGSSLLDRLIERATGGLRFKGPGHSACLRNAGADPTIIESTIEGNLNGVQSHPLSELLGGYPKGSSAAALLLSDETRARIDWFKFYAYCGSIDGIAHYDTPGLFRFLLPEAFDKLPGSAMVCSVCVAAILEHCGAISGVNWARMRPQDLVEMPGVFKGWIPLMGNPPVRNFSISL